MKRKFISIIWLLIALSDSATLLQAQDPFVITVNTRLPGSSCNTCFTIPTPSLEQELEMEVERGAPLDRLWLFLLV